jgi:predicted Zn-dependent protease
VSLAPLEPPDIHYFSAAIGWLELGSAEEARAELGRIAAERQSHPDVLEVRWMICAQEGRWDEGLDVARSLVERAPDRPSGWLHQAYALRRLPEGGVQRAWDALLPVAERFTKEAIIPYNLSCYACQLQHLDMAHQWLKRAADIGGKEKIKQMALQDPDLQPLWEELRGNDD